MLHSQIHELILILQQAFANQLVTETSNDSSAILIILTKSLIAKKILFTPLRNSQVAQLEIRIRGTPLKNEARGKLFFNI